MVNDQGMVVLLWSLGASFSFFAGVAVHLYMQIGKVRDRLEASTGMQLKEIRDAVSGLKAIIDSDRAILAEHRVKIAHEMVTRDELERQVERMIAEMDRRWPKQTAR